MWFILVFKEHNIFLVHFYIYKKKNNSFYNFVVIIVKYYGCLCAYFLWKLLCVFMCVYIVMGDYLCVFTCICVFMWMYSNGQLFILIINKCVILGYIELVWWLFILKMLILFLINMSNWGHIFSFVLKVCKKTNIQLNIYPHNTLHNNLGYK